MTRWGRPLDGRPVALRRKPIIPAEEAVGRFCTACGHDPSPHSPLRPWTLQAMATLKYCAGLRLGEVVRLRLGDFDVRAGTIDVRETKFFKSRRLPLKASVAAMLTGYLARRLAAGAPSQPAAPLFWSRARRAGYTLSGAEQQLTDCLAASGLRMGDRKSWTRPHDLRHYPEPRIIPTKMRLSAQLH